jgi:hypothetical protein
MKQAIIFASLLFMSAHAQSQVSSTDIKMPKVSGAQQKVTQQTLNSQLQQIMNVTGLHSNFIIKEARVRNVEASISKRKRYILYNREFLEQVNAGTRSQWGSLALLAHEIGHHLNGHTIRKSGSNPRVELEADEFAGFVLHQLGATLLESQAVMKFIAGSQASKTHPARHDREQAIKTGWGKAVGLKTGEPEIAMKEQGSSSGTNQ